MNIMLTKIRNSKIQNQSGMASFLVVTIIVTLIALVSVGFSQLADREARQALDRQLSDEAYYAAESGLNDARNYLASNTESIKDCSLKNNNASFANHGHLDAAGTVRYSCLLIDPQPTELTYPLNPGQTVVFPISESTLDNLYFSWENQSYSDTKLTLGNLNPKPQLPQENNLNQNATGLLRVGIYPVPTSNITGNTNSDLNNVSKVYYLYPNGGDGHAGTGDYKNDNSGTFLDGKCKDPSHQNALPAGSTATPLFCNVEVTKIYDALKNSSVSTFYVSLTAKYQPLNVIIQAETKDASNPVNCAQGKLLCISGVMATVDSTGAGNDVLRRLKVNVPLQSSNSAANYGIQSMQAVCKLFRVPVTNQGMYGQPKFDGSAPNNDNMCLYPSFDSGAIDGSGSP